jgi:GST-like protein
MIDLYFAPTANGKRAAVIMAESGLPYRIVPVDFAAKPAELLRLNPIGHIPVIVDPNGPDGAPLVLAQSGAIVLYIAEKTGRFMPADPARRAAALQWFMQACSDVAGASAAWFLAGHDFPEKSEANMAFLARRLVDFFRACDGRLDGRDYLADEISIADLALYPFFVGRKALVEQAGGLDRLVRWGRRLAERPGVARGMAGQ